MRGLPKCLVMIRNLKYVVAWSIPIYLFFFKNLGKIEAQTIDGDGKFIARGSESRIQGPSLRVVTKNGDINIESDCYSEECHLISQQGDIRLRNVYDTDVNVTIKEVGNASAFIVRGSINMNIANGRAGLYISSLTKNSAVNISDGDVHLCVPKHIEELFKLKVTAPSVKIDSNLKHTRSDMKSSAEFSRSWNNNDTSDTKSTSMENSSEIQDLKTFETLSDSKNEDLPILEVNVRKGTVNISVFQKDTSQETNYECGNLL